MDGKEYVAIFQELGIERSRTVKFMEQQIKTFERLEKEFIKKGDNANAKIAYDQAEITKWEAIAMAEYEKENGEIDW